MKCKNGLDHEKLGVPCTACRLDMYKENKNIFSEIDKIQNKYKENKNERS